MRIIKDPFPGDLLLSLDSFESKQVKDKGYIKILHDDLSAIITEELRNIHLHKEKTRDAKIRNKSKANTSNS